MSGLKAEDIDIVIMATSSPDDMFGDATTVAASIGCKRGVVAFDLTAACSGFLFASVTAGQFLTTGAYQRALVIGADALTRWVDWDDRNTCILFGDGAGAAVFDSSAGVGSGGGLLGWAMHSDGGGHNCLTLEYQGEEKLLTQGKGVTSGRKFAPLQMNGREVYKFATREVPTVIQEALENAGMSVEDVDHLLLHQANIRIMETVAQRLGMPMEKVITNLHEYGNTSAASIPLALDEAVRSGQVKKGDVIACAGFGAGLSWGSAIIRWG
jgi:3-oxoacyl-[acyl-carrier-protein] synthase-3